MKVLLIGQLPKEIGGNYTTGAANVVYELSKQREDGVLFTTSMQPILQIQLQSKQSSFQYQYIGYKFSSFQDASCSLVSSLWTFFRHMMNYYTVDHQNVFRYAFYEDNIREAIERVQPDLIHVNSIANVSPVRFAIGKSEIPILLHVNGIFYRGDKKDVVNRDRNLGNINLADAYSGLNSEFLTSTNLFLAYPKIGLLLFQMVLTARSFIIRPKKLRFAKSLTKDGCRCLSLLLLFKNVRVKLAFLKNAFNVGHRFPVLDCR